MGKVKKILFAEEEDVFSGQGGMLLRNGFRIFIAKSTKDALALHKGEKMDLIVADIDLPEIGGDQLCASIKRDPKLKKVYISLICSGKRSDLRRCDKSGADSYLRRPPELKAITEKICRILDVIERRDKRVLLKCKVHGSYKDEPFFSTSQNLSNSGILFETDWTLARGDTISFSFFLPDATRIEAEGKVVRVLTGEDSTYMCGVEFQELTPGSRENIEEFVSRSEAITGEEIY